MLLGMAGTVYDSIRYNAKLAKAVGPMPPEERLRGACVGGIVSRPALLVACSSDCADLFLPIIQLLPISLAWLAASARPEVHWAAPTIAGGLFGCSMLLSKLPHADTQVFATDR